MISKENGQFYKIWEDNIETIYNSDYMLQVRKKMLDGDIVDACSQCYQIESHGGFSMRMQSNRDPSEEPGHLDLNKKFMPTSYDLKLNNLCNLKCRMCQPRDSHLLYNEFSKILSTDSAFDAFSNASLEDPDLKIPLNEIPDWPKTEHFKNELRSNLNKIKKIAFVGGEPLLINETYELLDECIKAGVAGKIFLIFTSNFMHVPFERVLLRLKNFKKVIINISLDAVGEELNYIRFPSNIETIIKNIKTIKKQLPTVHIQLSPTVQIYNVLYLDRVYLLAEKFLEEGVELSPRAINLTFLEFPLHLNVRIAPTKLRDIAIPRLQNLLSLTPILMQDPVIKSNLIQLINILQHDFLNIDNLIPEFLYYSNTLDKFRNQSGNKILPELFSTLSDYEPKSPELPYYKLREQGWILAQNQKYSEAIQKFELSVMTSPDKYLDYREMAWMHLKSGNFLMALINSRNAHSLNPDDKFSLRGLCFSLDANGLNDELKNYLERAIELSPEDLELINLKKNKFSK